MQGELRCFLDKKLRKPSIQLIFLEGIKNLPINYLLPICVMQMKNCLFFFVGWLVLIKVYFVINEEKLSVSYTSLDNLYHEIIRSYTEPICFSPYKWMKEDSM